MVLPGGDGRGLSAAELRAIFRRADTRHDLTYVRPPARISRDLSEGTNLDLRDVVRVRAQLDAAD